MTAFRLPVFVNPINKCPNSDVTGRGTCVYQGAKTRKRGWEGLGHEIKAGSGNGERGLASGVLMGKI